MLRTFNVERTAQAAGILLEAVEGQRMPYIHLLKMLYVADRESIGETGFPVTGDDVFATKLGPVLSLTYDLIKGNSATPAASRDMPIWKQWLRTVGDYDIELVGEPGYRKLSRYEIEKLRDVAARYAARDRWEVIRELHHKLPEWEKNYLNDGSSHLISAEDILTAVGQGPNAGVILADAEAYQAFAAPSSGFAVR